MSDFADHLRDDLNHRVKRTEEISKTISEIVAESVSDVVKGTQEEIDRTKRVREILQKVIQEVSHMNADFEVASRAMVVGVLRGEREMLATKEPDEAAFNTIAETASCIVEIAAEAAGDIVEAAKGAVQGAIDGAVELGLDPEEAASVAANGAMQTAYVIGSDVGTNVRNAVTGTISGTRVALRKPFKK